MRIIKTLLWVAVYMAGCFNTAAIAQSAATYPAKPIRLVVPFPPGSGTDILARILAQEMSKSWKQTVVVDNRPGASTIIGTDIVAKAPPDGYALVMASNNHAINSTLFAKLPFDPVKDFTPVGQVAVLPFMLVVNPALPVNNVKDLLDLALAKPGKLNYASTGNGTPPHVAAELLKQQAGINLLHIPYKGSADAVTAVISGTVSVMFANTLSVLSQVRAGRLRALAVGSPQRIAIAPELPTVAESGFPGFDVNLWAGILAPANTPKDIVAKLNNEIVRILGLPDVQKNFAAQGAEITPSTPEQFAKFINDEIDRLGKVAKVANMHAD
jgi:tripartite-type tricarboxylate transporter receptor subunit TctC